MRNLIDMLGKGQFVFMLLILVFNSELVKYYMGTDIKGIKFLISGLLGVVEVIMITVIFFVVLQIVLTVGIASTMINITISIIFSFKSFKFIKNYRNLVFENML